MLPESTEIPDDAYAYCYEDPISKEELLKSINDHITSYVDRKKTDMENDIRYTQSVKWLYERAEGILGEIIKQRKEELGVAKSSQDRTINGLEEVGVILASITSLAIELKLLKD